jgi:hypothetical protein
MKKHLFTLSLIVLGCLATHTCTDLPTGPANCFAAAQDPVEGDRYYLNRCPQCHRYLGTRGDPIERSYDHRHIRFCHEECRVAFEANLPNSIARLDDQMIADQLPWYPLQSCVVTGEPLPAVPIDLIFRNRLVRLSNESARTKFLADPSTFWQKLTDATIEFLLPRYWVTKCPEQGTQLKPKADPQLIVVCASRIVRVCCLDCYDRVIERPANYLPLIDSALRSGPATSRPTAPTQK